MFRSKITLSAIIFLIFLIITSIIKNQSRIIEKQIYKLNKQISLKEKDLHESQLDFYYLTSPVVIEKKIEILGYNNYLPIDHSKIFLNLKNFINIEYKISNLKIKYEKKTKKN